MARRTTVTYKNQRHSIETAISIPFDESVEELVYILLDKHQVPIYHAEEVLNDLQNFIKTNQTECDSTELVYKAKDLNIDTITKDWESIMREEIAEYGERRCASDEELFAGAYHKMVHSPTLEMMLQQEHTFSSIVRQRSEDKQKKIVELEQQQADEMNNALERLDQDMNESEINQLVSQHYEQHAYLKVKLTSELDTIKEAQRREYREWLMQMLEQNQANSSMSSSLSQYSPLTPVAMDIIPKSDMNSYKGLRSNPIAEESFTIHLGSQLKHMYNIRILSANIMDLCTVPDNEMSTPTPQLIQTALALYSNDISGFVLMTDNKIGSRLTQEFQEICQKTTEFHFQHIDDQLEKISQTVQQYMRDNSPASKNKSELLQCGDFYMTRHSNLAETHVIFHMVTHDSLRGSDINSRHPVVLGLRNILKTACSNDVTSLTIPLLLQYDLTEEMTVSWCEKRAELVFKCVKGFMIEMASWGGSDLKNLQFMLPQGISAKVFQSLTDMLPRIFKVSNPKVFK